MSPVGKVPDSLKKTLDSENYCIMSNNTNCVKHCLQTVNCLGLLVNSANVTHENIPFISVCSRGVGV